MKIEVDYLGFHYQLVTLYLESQYHRIYFSVLALLVFVLTNVSI